MQPFITLQVLIDQSMLLELWQISWISNHKIHHIIGFVSTKEFVMVDHIMHACPRSPVVLNSLHKIWKWSLFPLTNWSFTYEGILHFFYKHFNLLFILQVLSLIVITHAIHAQEISVRPIPLGNPNTGLEWKEKRTHHFHPWHVQQPVQFNFLHRTGEV